MAVYRKGRKYMASIGSGPQRIRKTFNTENEARHWELTSKGPAGALRQAAAALLRASELLEQAMSKR